MKDTQYLARYRDMREEKRQEAWGGGHAAPARRSGRAGLVLAVLLLVLTTLAPGCALFSSPPAPAPPGDSLGARIAETARSQIGTRYRYGGDTPDQGFDCSGLVQWAYARNGVRAPRTVNDQYRAGRPVSARNLAPGDLLFFATSLRRSTLHVGIATSPDRFVHSPSSRGRVREDRLSDPYWASVFSSARRLTP